MAFPNSKPPIDPLQARLERLRFLQDNGVSPLWDINAAMAQAKGFALPGLQQQGFANLALRRAVRKTQSSPPVPPPDRALFIGDALHTGRPCRLDSEEMGSVVLLGKPGSGKNVAARVMAHGLLQLPQGYRFEVLAQKGDEPAETMLFGDGLYVPLPMEPVNDWAPIGPEPEAFWMAVAEAIAIPKGLLEQTWPEISKIVAACWRSAANASWAAIVRALKWKSEQPGGREKHATASAALATYAASLGPKAYLEVGVDLRPRYGYQVLGVIGADSITMEVALGLRLVREQFEARVRGHSRKARLFLFIPEGHLVLGPETEFASRGVVSYVTRFLTMADSMGVKPILAAQSASRLTSSVLNACSTKFVFRQESPKEAEQAAGLVGCGKEAIPLLLSLPRGVAIVRSPGWEHAELIQVHHIPLEHPLREQEVLARFQADYDAIRHRCIYTPHFAPEEALDWRSLTRPVPPAGAQRPAAASPTPPTALLHDHLALLHEVAQHPLDGLAAHYARLGFGRERGNKILGELKAAGCIVVKPAQAAAKAGGRPPLIASLSALGWQMVKSGSVGFANPTHSPA